MRITDRSQCRKGAMSLLSIGVVLTLAGTSLTSCGVKGALEPPPGTPDTETDERDAPDRRDRPPGAGS